MFFKTSSDHIDVWVVAVRRQKGCEKPCGPASRRSSQIQRALRDLAGAGVGSREEVEAWESMRHRVMHGVLVTPYSTRRRATKSWSTSLASLMRALTKEAVRRAGTTERLGPPAMQFLLMFLAEVAVGNRNLDRIPMSD